MYIKGFNKNLCCMGFQFEVGKEYKTEWNGKEPLRLCTEDVFHFCDSIQNVYEFYSCDGDNNRFCEIEVLGDLITDGEKFGSNHIKIKREIIGDELNQLKGLINGNAGLFNSGSYNSGWNNSGSHNSGWNNSGWHNSGWDNSGWHNSGSYNSGWNNSGWHNSGWNNSGDFNSCDNSNGLFCTKEPKISIFNIQTDYTMTEFQKTKYYEALNSSIFPLTEYKDNRLITHTYKEACRMWWDNMSEENKEIIKSMPNFNKDIFKEITGIEV